MMEKERKEIDKLDQLIVDAISQRLEHARRIGRMKKGQGLETVDPAREGRIYDRITRMSKGRELDEHSMRRIFFEIISMGRSVQGQMTKSHPSDIVGKIAFQGEAGAYSEAALRKAFPHAEPIACPTFYSVFDGLDSGLADAALLPVENSTEGSVSAVYDLLRTSDAKAFKEVFLRVEHCLLQKGDEHPDKVYSHPQALEQCRGYIKDHELSPVPFHDTAGAARHIAENPEGCAIASELAAERYGLRIVERNIEDNPDNMTRFLALSKKISCPFGRGRYKTSLFFAIRHEPGSLFKALEALSKEGINMTKLESRPTKSTPWEYLFFLDIEGHLDDRKIEKALEGLRENTIFLKDFGSYERGD